jgi:putative ABC transport system substrate-binding protein
MRRRDLTLLFGGAAIGWPLAARRQQSAAPVIGYLSSGSPAPYARHLDAFRQGLTEAGFVEGRSAVIEYRWAEGRYDRLTALAADLVGRQVAVIAAMTLPSALAAKAATATIPIVFYGGGDPVDQGLVASFNRPGGNITGISTLNPQLAPKRLEVLRELVPKAAVIALLVNPTNSNAELQVRETREATRNSGQQIHVLTASRETDLDAVFATLRARHETNA